MDENFPDNLIITTFDYTLQHSYYLISNLEKNINCQFKVLEHLGDNKEYAFFYSYLSYFNTHVFLIKNYSLTTKTDINLFDQISYEKEYLINQIPLMYILMTYSDELKNINDIHNFIKADKLHVKLLPLKSKKYIKMLHLYIQKYSII